MTPITFLFLFALLCTNVSVFATGKMLGKVLICGVCRNIEPAIANTISNIELLGEKFDDYGVIIYENNSEDLTATLLFEWAETNPRVVFISEILTAQKLPSIREVGIARARNIVLNIAKRQEYNDFEHLIMVDLDFITPWPIDEIVATTLMPGDWDCISANGVFNIGTLYWDRYAFRDEEYPFGPEVIGSAWRAELNKTWFGLHSAELKPVFSGFGGLAVYKRSTIIQFKYSGKVTKDLQIYYAKILKMVEPTNEDVITYLKINRFKNIQHASERPIIFRSTPPSDRLIHSKRVVCCEHVTLHASMALSGHDKFFINPRLVMEYSHEIKVTPQKPQN